MSRGDRERSGARWRWRAAGPHGTLVALALAGVAWAAAAAAAPPPTGLERWLDCLRAPGAQRGRALEDALRLWPGVQQARLLPASGRDDAGPPAVAGAPAGPVLLLQPRAGALAEDLPDASALQTLGEAQLGDTAPLQVIWLPPAAAAPPPSAPAAGAAAPALSRVGPFWVSPSSVWPLRLTLGLLCLAALVPSARWLLRRRD